MGNIFTFKSELFLTFNFYSSCLEYDNCLNTDLFPVFQNYDGLCVLPINIINEKIYIFMWTWFVFLAFVSSLYQVLGSFKNYFTLIWPFLTPPPPPS